MRRLEYIIPPAYDGRKVVHFLRGEAGCSATLVKSLKLSPDGILLDGAHIRTIDPLRAGAMLSITLRDEVFGGALPVEGFVPVLYEDADVVVFNKPAEMPCHPAKRHQTDTLANIYAARCAAAGIAAPCRVVNRLDRNTTGAVVVAKNAFAAAALAGKVEKVYLAVAEGIPPLPAGMIDLPIGRPDPVDIRRAVLPDGQPACTEYRVLKTARIGATAYSLLRCTLPTGRTHQIRVHFSHFGCPLLGDELYGGNPALISRQALHCAVVRFCQPVGGKVVTVVAPVPKDMQKFV